MVVRGTINPEMKEKDQVNKILLKREVPDQFKEKSTDIPGKKKKKKDRRRAGTSELDSSSESISVGGLEQSLSEPDMSQKDRFNHIFNFEFVIVEERYLRNKCLVYLQSDSKFY